jgi:hypothetical protein
MEVYLLYLFNLLEILHDIGLLPYLLLSGNRTDELLRKSRITAVLDEIHYKVLEQKTESGNGRIQQDGNETIAKFENELNDDNDSLEDIIEDMSSTTECLIDLKDAFESPALDCNQTESTTPQEIVNETSSKQFPAEYYSEMIASRFPKANKSIIEALGHRSWKRFLRCQRERERSINTQSYLGDSLETSTIIGTEFHDSGLGTSVPSTAFREPEKGLESDSTNIESYAETITSFYQEDGQVKRIPSLPPQAKSGAPFECLICGKMIRVLNKALWK